MSPVGEWWFVGLAVFAMGLPWHVRRALVTRRKSAFAPRQSLPFTGENAGRYWVELTAPPREPGPVAHGLSHQWWVDQKALHRALAADAPPRVLAMEMDEEEAARVVEDLRIHGATATATHAGPRQRPEVAPVVRWIRFVTEVLALIACGALLMMLTHLDVVETYWWVWLIAVVVVPPVVSSVVHRALWDARDERGSVFAALPAVSSEGAEWGIELVDPGPNPLRSEMFFATQWSVAPDLVRDVFRAANLPQTLIVGLSEPSARSLESRLSETGARVKMVATKAAPPP